MTVRLSSLPTSAASAGWNAISSVFGWSIIFTVVLISAVGLYGAFYVMYLPAPHHVKPVNFIFRTHGYSPSRPADEKILEGKQVLQRLEIFPESVVHLRSNDKRSAGERILMRGQSYKVSLELLMPYSDVNRGIGMFMTELTFRSKDLVTVGSSSRSALIPYTSKLISTLSSVFDFFLLHFGWKEEKQLLRIVLFEDFVDDSYHPAETAKITIYCKDLQIYSAKLHIESIYTGIRYYMFYWPVTSAAFGILSNISLGTILAIWMYLKFCKTTPEDEFEQAFEIDENYAAASTTDAESVHIENADQTDDDALQQQAPPLNSENIAVGQRRIQVRHLPVRRLCGPQTILRRRNPTRDRAVSLTRPVRSNPRDARTAKDEWCQTEARISDQSVIETTESTFFDAPES